MATLLNNQSIKVSGGKYALKVGGALDLQWQVKTEGFSTITDGSFSAASDVIIDLPACEVKVINGSTNELEINPVRG